MCIRDRRTPLLTTVISLWARSNAAASMLTSSGFGFISDLPLCVGGRPSLEMLLKSIRSVFDRHRHSVQIFEPVAGYLRWLTPIDSGTVRDQTLRSRNSAFRLPLTSWLPDRDPHRSSGQLPGLRSLRYRTYRTVCTTCAQH